MTSRYIALVIGVWSFGAFACGVSSTGPTSTTGPFAVLGQVHDFQTNAAVQGATVVLADPSNTTSIAALWQSLTDGSGSYQLSMTAGHYQDVDLDPR